MQVFVKALESDDRQLRRRAGADFPELLRRNFSVMSLVHYLQDTNSPLSLYAADSLGTLAEINVKLPENALPALTNSLTDLRPKVRLNAAAALGYFRNAPDIVGPALLDAWQDPDPSVRRTATNAFFGLAPYSVLDTRAKPYTAPADSSILTRLLDHPDIRIREMATKALRILSSSNAVNQTNENTSR
jgi:HEAT repeat protein